MPPQSKESVFSDVLDLIAAKLVADDVMPAAKIGYVVDWTDVPQMHSEHDLLLAPGDETAVGNFAHGSGRLDVRANRILEVIVRTRRVTDKAGDAKQVLTHRTKGHLQLEDAVIDSLQGFYPTSAAMNELAFGMEYLRIARPQRKNSTGQKEWLGSAVMFTVPYRRVIA